MSEGIAATIERYVLNGTDEDLKRLLRISELLAGSARSAMQRAGVQYGWSAIECGCGPLGALPVLAEAVGPSGRVVGVDVNQTAIERVRSTMDILGVSYVTAVVGDLTRPPLRHSVLPSTWPSHASSCFISRILRVRCGALAISSIQAGY